MSDLQEYSMKKNLKKNSKLSNLIDFEPLMFRMNLTNDGLECELDKKNIDTEINFSTKTGIN